MRFALVFAVLTVAAQGFCGETLVPAVQTVNGYLVDAENGRLIEEDIFSPGYVPLNRLEVPIMVMVTVDLGEKCVLRRPTDEEARAIARGERAPFVRPAACDKPTGRLVGTIKLGDGSQEKQQIALGRFRSATDGKVRIPFVFYRKSPCLPIELSVRISGRSESMLKKANFVCKE